MDEMLNEQEIDELYEELCEKLQGKVPDELLNMLKSIEPRMVSVKMMYDLGGRLILRYPEVEIVKPYDHPEDVEALEDSVDGYDFVLTKNGLQTFSAGMRTGQDVDDVVKQCDDLEGYFPIKICKGDDVLHVFMIDAEQRTIDIPFTETVQIDMYADGSDESFKVAKDNALEQLKASLEATMKAAEEVAANGPNWTDDPSERDAVAKWCEKHNYKIQYICHTNIDFFH